MSNQDRREKRFQRRKIKRQNNRNRYEQTILSYDDIFTFKHLWKAFWLCRKEVSWKPSIQIFQQNLSVELVKLEQELFSPNGFQTDGFIEFDICERGKMRHIKSVNIRERIVQRCFCDYYLVPLLIHNIIHDNGASLKDKGITFSLNRLQYHLDNFYKKYKDNNGYIVLYDFSNYFGNIDHNILFSIVDEMITDNRCKKLYHHLVDNFGDIGLGLGSQVSQISAIIFPNYIDQKISNNRNIEAYARYMDDGYIIFRDKQSAKECIDDLLLYTNRFNIKLNPKKVKICKLKDSFIYLKKRFRLNNNGQVIVKLNRNNIYKHTRKIKKLIKLVKLDKLKIENVEHSHKAWLGQLKRYKNKKSIYNVDKKINRFINDYNKEKYYGLV